EHGPHQGLELARSSDEAGVGVALRAIARGEEPFVLQDAVRIGDGPIQHLRFEEPVSVPDERPLATLGIARPILRKSNGTGHPVTLSSERATRNRLLCSHSLGLGLEGSGHVCSGYGASSGRSRRARSLT